LNSNSKVRANYKFSRNLSHKILKRKIYSLILDFLETFDLNVCHKTVIISLFEKSHILLTKQKEIKGFIFETGYING
jgi:hypothetical protein